MFTECDYESSPDNSKGSPLGFAMLSAERQYNGARNVPVLENRAGALGGAARGIEAAIASRSAGTRYAQP
jgi:hypothetical protein